MKFARVASIVFIAALLSINCSSDDEGDGGDQNTPSDGDDAPSGGDSPGDGTDPGDAGDGDGNGDGGDAGDGNGGDAGDSGDNGDGGDAGDGGDNGSGSRVCGDDVCDGNAGETCTACAECDTRAAVCGNGECQSGESSDSCEADCGPNSWPAEWASFEEEVRELINRHRAAGTDCPGGARSPVGPLANSAALRSASRLHSWDESRSDYFAHDSCNGRSPWDRAEAAGTSAFAETIGGGYRTAEAVVQGWLDSSGHCDIIMNGDHGEIGIGFAAPDQFMWTALYR